MKGFKDNIRQHWYLRWILFFSSWVFQGILRADKTEKIYKISCSILFTLLSFLVYRLHFNLMCSIIISLITGHTINWLINGNFNIILIHFLFLKKLSINNLFNYLESLKNRLVSTDWVLYSASFGSICRGELKASSDIDVSIVRKPGLQNAVKSICFALKEKKIADLKRIPLEIYISDSPKNSINRYKAERNPIVLYDKEDTINRYYEVKLTLEEAKRLNNVK